MMILISPLLLAVTRPQSDTQSQMGPTLSGSFAPETWAEFNRPELVLVNWNIERGVRLTKILQALQAPLAADLCVLQEVDLHTRRTGYRNVAEELAREMEMNYIFGIEFKELAQGRSRIAAFTGQAMLCRFQISRARVLRFRHQLYDWGPRWKPRWSKLQPRQGGRMALVAEFRWGGRLCVIYNLHLESQASDRGRTKQIREVLEDLNTHYTPETPVILAGDLNTQQGDNSPVLRELKANGFQDALQDYQGPLGTKVGSQSRRKKDWILVRHLRFTSGQIVGLAISDHYPLLVRLALPISPKSDSSSRE